MHKITEYKIILLFVLTLLSGSAMAAIAVDDQATVVENSGISLLFVFNNDTINKGESVTASTQPTNGLISVLPGLGINYQPNTDYCNNGITTDDFTYTLTGGATATVFVTVNCLAGSPPAQVVPVNQTYWLLFLLLAIVIMAKFKTAFFRKVKL